MKGYTAVSTIWMKQVFFKLEESVPATCDGLLLMLEWVDGK